MSGIINIEDATANGLSTNYSLFCNEGEVSSSTTITSLENENTSNINSVNCDLWTIADSKSTKHDSKYSLKSILSSAAQSVKSTQLADTPQDCDAKESLLENETHDEYPLLLLGLGPRSSISTTSVHSDTNIETPCTQMQKVYRKPWFTKKQWLLLMSMLLLYFADYATMSIMAPFFPDMAKKMELNKFMNGSIYNIYTFIIVVASPIVGLVAPITDPCYIYIAGITLVGVSNIGFGMIQYIRNRAIFIAVALGLRMLGALGAACYLTVIYAIVPDVFPCDINTINGLLEMTVGVGMCMGPTIGTWLYSLGGFSLPFIILGIFMILTIPICWVSFPIINKQSQDICPKSLLYILTKPGNLLSFTILVFSSFCQTMLFPTIQLHMRKVGMSLDNVGLIFLLLSIIYSLASPLIGLATDRYQSPEAFMLTGLPIMSISLFFMGHLPMHPHLDTSDLIRQYLLPLVMLGLSTAMCIVPSFASVLHISTSKDEKLTVDISAKVGGLWLASYALGEMIGPLYSGIMNEVLSFEQIINFTCLLPLVLMFLLCGYLYFKHKKEQRYQFVN